MDLVIAVVCFASKHIVVQCLFLFHAYHFALMCDLYVNNKLIEMQFCGALIAV